MRRPLPDPEWADPEFCVCCGYCLTGLSAPSRCPECGTPFLEKTLVLHGVPRSAAGTSPIRRVAWVLLIVVFHIAQHPVSDIKYLLLGVKYNLCEGPFVPRFAVLNHLSSNLGRSLHRKPTLPLML